LKNQNWNIKERENKRKEFEVEVGKNNHGNEMPLRRYVTDIVINYGKCNVHDKQTKGVINDKITVSIPIY